MIDSHCHLYFKNLRNKIPTIVENAKNNNITAILSVNTNENEFQEHYDLIKNYQSIFMSYGQHPENVNKDNIISCDNILKKSENYKKIIGIGETGIDLYHSKKNFIYQVKSFENHIEASIKTQLPLIIHQRNSENEIIDILSNYKNEKLNLVMHCFTGSNKFKNFCINSNFYISISGIITFKNADNLRETIKDYPIDKILIETDAPFLSPVPKRGKLNEPSNIVHTYEYLSHIFNINLYELEKITDKNFYSLFNKAKVYKNIEYEN